MTTQFTQAQMSEHHNRTAAARQFAFQAMRDGEMTFEEAEEFCNRSEQRSFERMEQESN